jgi:hypothetical protein
MKQRLSITKSARDTYALGETEASGFAFGRFARCYHF